MVTRWIAEHGYTLKEAPHTYRAFLASANREFDGMLFSVRFTKDHYPIASNKASIAINGTNYLIEQYTLDELTELGLFQFPNELSTKLKDFLKLALHYQIQPFIQINRNTSYKEIDILLELLDSFGVLYQTKIISPKKEYLTYLRNRDLELDLQYEVSDYTDQVFLDCCKYHFDLLMRVEGFSQKMVYITGLLHEYNLKVACIGMTNPKAIEKYAQIPVDYLYTGGTK